MKSANRTVAMTAEGGQPIWNRLGLQYSGALCEATEGSHFTPSQEHEAWVTGSDPCDMTDDTRLLPYVLSTSLSVCAAEEATPPQRSLVTTRRFLPFKLPAAFYVLTPRSRRC